MKRRLLFLRKKDSRIKFLIQEIIKKIDLLNLMTQDQDHHQNQNLRKENQSILYQKRSQIKISRKKNSLIFLSKWRKGWDSNPRYGHPHTRFPNYESQIRG